MIVPKVASDSVWKSLKIIFISSALLFLINIFFGFSNAITAGEISRANILIHLHSGSIGWITLSAIGLAIWVLTGSREVSRSYERHVRLLSWLSVAIFALYIPNFWLAFSRGQGPLLALLPLFGGLSVVVLWWASFYALYQLGQQPQLSTVHLLATGALLVAAIGATVGALLGMERVVGRFLPLPDVDRVGAHAGMMDSYLFLLASALIEWFAADGQSRKWTYAGLAQTVLWVVGAALVPIAFFTGSVPQVVPIFVVFMLLGTVIFLVRVGWRAALLGPAATKGRAWIFFSAIWLVVYMALFMYFAAQTGAGAPMPPWFNAVFAHSGYIGMMTNGLLVMHLARGQAAGDRFSWAEPVSLWLINLGLLAFVLPRILVGTRLGAVVMGTGVLLGVLLVLYRMLVSEPERQPAPSG